MKVVLSEHNLETEEGFEQVFNVSKIFMHSFNYKTFNGDIMLIKVGCHFEAKSGAPDTQFMFVRQRELFGNVRVLCVFVYQLSEPAQLNANVQPALLPDEYTPPLIYDTCTVSGWGVTQIYSSYLSPVLRAVDVKIVPLCNYYYWGMISPNMICAGSWMGGKDSCQVLVQTF